MSKEYDAVYLVRLEGHCVIQASFIVIEFRQVLLPTELIKGRIQ